ncbi:hypothetical protein IWQ46_001065 [Aquimarina sp. EL_35]|nr:hypothetical protein [Aquimarina sp. EL_35]MBG6150660.1 hypothetical protein [Aquimarina sp. EL_32]
MLNKKDKCPRTKNDKNRPGIIGLYRYSLSFGY